MNKAIQFLKEVYGELTKTTWLSRQDVIRSTIAVGIIVLLMSIYISSVDFGLSVFLGAVLGGR
ncbi:MAG: preprotein translocase subunit SecE [bacterium]